MEIPVVRVSLGTIREVEAEETLRRVLPVARRLGITRVANVTGLDDVGVPVWVAVRPLAKSLSVSQGKGLTHELAQCSAIMESIELYYAENTRPEGLELELTVYTSDDRFVDPTRLPLHANAFFEDDIRIHWVRGINIISGSELWIPHDLFNLDTTRLQNHQRLFISSSNGLASGNSYNEAVIHGICEAIERDQLTLWMIKGGNAPGTQTRLQLDSIDDIQCQTILQQCRRAGLEVFIWYATVNIGMPVFFCIVADHRGVTPFRQRAAGSGCHPLKNIALSRALTEALQSRLTHISGTRDDVDWHKYRHDIPRTIETDSWINKMRGQEQLTDFRQIDTLRYFVSITDLLVHTINAVKLAGLEEVVVVRLAQDLNDINVVYVCIPDLEFTILRPTYSPGRRAMEFAANGQGT